MNKKKVYQAFIFFILLGFIVFFFTTYYKKEEILSKEIESTEKNKEEFSNLTQNIEFTTNSKKGHNYRLFAKTGETDFDNPDVIFLTGVKAIIKGRNNLLVNIESDFGKYNSKNHDTVFSKNVVITESINKINSDYLDLSLENNLATMSGNVVFKNLTTKMNADRVNLNLENKEAIIFMNDNSKKININRDY